MTSNRPMNSPRHRSKSRARTSSSSSMEKSKLLKDQALALDWAHTAIPELFMKVDEIGSRIITNEEFVAQDRNLLQQMQAQLARLDVSVQRALVAVVPKLDQLIAAKGNNAGGGETESVLSEAGQQANVLTRIEEFKKAIAEVTKRVDSMEKRMADVAAMKSAMQDIRQRVDVLEEAVDRDRDILRAVQTKLAELNESVQAARHTLIRKIDCLVANTDKGTAIPLTGPKPPVPSAAAPSGDSEADAHGATATEGEEEAVVPTMPTSSVLAVAEKGDSEELLRLLEQGADIRQRNRSGDTALHLAAARGHERTVLHLVGAGLGVDTPGRYRRTPLHAAASRGQAGVVRRLLMAGAKVDARDLEGDTPLLIAARHGYSQAVAELMRGGVMTGGTDRMGRTPIMWAANNGQIEVVMQLMHKASLSETDHNGDTAMLLAAKAGHWRVVELLAQSGVSLDASDKDGRTTMVYAAKAGKWGLVRLLLQKGATAKSGRGSESPLLLAAEHGQEDEIRELIRHGAASGDQELEEALARVKEAAVLWAFEDAVPGVLRGAVGQEAMRRAARDGRHEALSTLLEAGVDINSADRCGHTALHFASHMGQKTCVSLLLRRGAFTDVKDREGMTPLHYASREGKEDCVRGLLEAGASAQLKDKKGTTALNLAMNNAIRRLLQQPHEP